MSTILELLGLILPFSLFLLFGMVIFKTDQSIKLEISNKKETNAATPADTLTLSYLTLSMHMRNSDFFLENLPLRHFCRQCIIAFSPYAAHFRV